MEQTPQETQTNTKSPQESPKQRSKLRKFLPFLIIGGVLLIALIIFFVLQKPPQDATKPATLPSIGASKADENGLITERELECVPRGHDYYRTNNTLHVDAQNPDIAYIGVEYKGIYRTSDGGKTWLQADKGVKAYAREADTKLKCVQELGRIIADPKDSKRLLLSRVETPSTLQMIFGETAGLYESKDGGENWKHIITPNMNASGSRGIAFDPTNTDTIFYGVNNMKPSFKIEGQQFTELFNKSGILYKTSDAGKSWEELPTGAEEGFRVLSLNVDKTGKNMWLGTLMQNPEGGLAEGSRQQGMLKSIDGGNTWKSYASQLPAAYRVLGSVAVAPTQFNHVYITSQTMEGAPKAYYSLDGETFQVAQQYMLVASYDPHDASGQRLIGYSPYDNPALYESTDGGKTWAHYANLPSEVNDSDKFGVRISEIMWSQSDSRIMYMSGSGGLVWKSINGGKTWETVLNLEKLGGENKNKDGSTKSREPDQ